MKIINRYVLKEHVGPFLFSITALTSLMLLQYIARRFGDLVGKGLEWTVIGEFFLLSIPFTVAMTLPMAVLVSVLYAFSRLGSENEVTALKAGGISMRSLVNPVLATAALLTVAMVLFNDQILPRSNHRLQQLQTDIFSTKPTFALREQVINTVQDQRLFLRAGRIEPGSSRLWDIDIYDLSDPTRRRTINADSGVLALAPNNKDLVLTLYDGVMTSIPTTNQAQLMRMHFAEQRLRVRDIVNEFEKSATDSGAVKGDREMSVCEMQRELRRTSANSLRDRHAVLVAEWAVQGRQGPEPVPTPYVPPRGIGHEYCRAITWIGNRIETLAPRTAGAQGLPVQGQQAPPVVPSQGQAIPVTVRDSTGVDTVLVVDTTTVPVAMPIDTAPVFAPSAGLPAAENTLQSDSVTLVSAMAQYKMSRYTRNRYAIEIQKKFSLAAACIVLALVGAPIALRFPRGGVGLVIGVSFFIFALYYICLILGETLANKDLLAPVAAMWIANGVFLVIGLILYARVGREAGSNRGGDMTELRELMRLRLATLARRLGLHTERRRI